MNKIDKRIFIIAISISFIYVLIGTYDNLNELHFENFLNNILCRSKLCEFSLLILYSQSYLYGALFCAFFGGSDIAFIFCQIIVFIIFAFLIYYFLIIIKVIRKFVFNKK